MNCRTSLAATVLMMLALILVSPMQSYSAGNADAAALLAKAAEDNGLAKNWELSRKYFTAGIMREGDIEGAFPLIQKCAKDPSSFAVEFGSIGDQLAAAKDFTAALDVIGRTLGYEIPAPPAFTLETDPNKLLESLYSAVEIAGNDATVATNPGLFKNDRFVTHSLLFTTVHRLSEGCFLNYEASSALAKSLAKTNAQLWIDTINAMRNSSKVDRRMLWAALRSLSFLSKQEVLDHIAKVLGAADFGKVENADGVEGSIKYFKKMPVGRVIIGGIGKTTYKKPAALIIDLGGSDDYTYAASTQFDVPCSVVIDLAGNDNYTSKKFEGWTVGGVLGVSLLIDREGMDEYSGFKVGLASAIYGACALVDLAGNDRYIGGELSCGSAIYGVAMLYDTAGDDSYLCAPYSIGFGGPSGVGVLLDTTGNDSYKSTGKLASLDNSKEPLSFSIGCGFGFHPLSKDGGAGNINAFGGIGYLCDVAGADKYDGGYGSCGTGFYCGVGTIYDVEGNDNYKGGSISLGSAIYSGIGLILEKAGADTYTTNGYHSIGSSYETGLGWLLDFEGKDSYNGDEYCIATTSHNGIAIMMDLAGSDAYRCKNFGNGDIGAMGVHYEEDWPFVGFLLDFGKEPNVFAGTARKDKVSELRTNPGRMDFVLFLTSPSSFEEAMKGSLKIQ